MRGRDLVAALRRKFGANSESALVRKIGGTGPLFTQLNNRRAVAPGQVANLVDRAQKVERKSALQGAINVIVEFFPIEKCRSPQDARWEILENNERTENLIQSLRGSSGLYFFYNSQGQIIYVGKTTTNLLSEMNNAFNREMAAHQIWRVNHPANRPFQTPFGERNRKIVRRKIQLHETAHYFSAYNVDLLLIGKLEALFIRALPNDLTNVRIEGQTAVSVG